MRTKVVIVNPDGPIELRRGRDTLWESRGLKVIDQQGRLFGLINVLDLIVLLACLILGYMGVMLYGAVRDEKATVVGIVPQWTYSDQTTEVLVVMDNNEIITGASGVLLSCVGGKRMDVRTTYDKRRRKYVGVMVLKGTPCGRYRLELTVTTMDVLGRRSVQRLLPADELLIVDRPEWEK